jgi:hypothetical protein
MLPVAVTQTAMLQQSICGSWLVMFVWTLNHKVRLYLTLNAYQDIQSLG